MSVFAERLKNLRDTTGQTQGEVGKAMGKSRESISKYEIGVREPDTGAIAAIAMHFNVSADYILGITDDFIPLHRRDEIPYCMEIIKGEPYLRDDDFVPYFCLAVKMRDNNVEVESADRLINRLIKLGKKAKTPLTV